MRVTHRLNTTNALVLPEVVCSSPWLLWITCPLIVSGQQRQEHLQQLISHIASNSQTGHDAIADTWGHIVKGRNVRHASRGLLGRQGNLEQHD